MAEPVINITDLSTKAAAALTTGDSIITFTSDGDTNQTPFYEAVAQANTENGCACMQEASLLITSAQVLALNATPLTIVAAQGTGYVIEVLAASVSITYGTAAYATNVNIQLITDGATGAQFKGGVLDATVSCIRKLQEQLITLPTTTTQLIANAALKVSVETGNPATGDSDITVRILYRVIDTN